MNRRNNAGQAKVAVVGIGNVGAAFAFALSLKRLVGELVLVDANSATVLRENARALGVI